MSNGKKISRSGIRPDAAACPLAEGSARMGIHWAIARRLVNSGVWRSFRINGRIYVYPDQLREWVAAQAGKQISA